MNTEVEELFSQYVPAGDRKVMGSAGYGARRDLSGALGVLVVDMTVEFAGDQPEPLKQSMRRFPNSCGDSAWDAGNKLKPLLVAARDSNIPVIYTKKNRDVSSLTDSKAWAMTHKAAAPGPSEFVDQVISPVAPQGSDVIVQKTKPSGFFGTPLLEVLLAAEVKEVAIAGLTTSGCVRATAVDAFSWGFGVTVLADAVADRIESSHAMSLFDISMKYGQLMSCAELRELVRSRE